MLENFKKYDESTYITNEDIAEELQRLTENPNKELKNELLYILEYIDAAAQNEYNRDAWRIFYNVLIDLVNKRDI